MRWGVQKLRTYFHPLILTGRKVCRERTNSAYKMWTYEKQKQRWVVFRLIWKIIITTITFSIIIIIIIISVIFNIFIITIIFIIVTNNITVCLFSITRCQMTWVCLVPRRRSTPQGSRVSRTRVASPACRRVTVVDYRSREKIPLISRCVLLFFHYLLTRLLTRSLTQCISLGLSQN